MKIEYKKSGATGKSTKTCVVFVGTKGKDKGLDLSGLDRQTSALVDSAHKDGAFDGKRKETVFFRQVESEKYKHLLVVGLGYVKSEEKPLNPEDLRVAGATVFHSCRAQKISGASVDLDTLFHALGEKHSTPFFQAFVEGLKLSFYEFKEHKSKSSQETDEAKKTASFPEKIELVIPQAVLSLTSLNREWESAFKQGLILADQTNFARWLGDHAANMMTPTILAETVVQKAKGTAIQVTVWDKAKIKKEGFGGLLGVSLGSDQEPRFIIMKYNGLGEKGGKKDPVYFVGKGLTFDSGGISIKPSANMDEMKYDMCGAAAVIGTIFALAELKAKVNVVGLVPATENMPGPSANKPGDIMVARNGKTVEILNTDAEGRLVLADALSYACEHKPQVIFDVATLTGAIVVSLGNTHTGVFTRDQKLMERIQQASQHSGELVWQMPLTDSHVEDIKGLHADWSNISNSKGAGSSTAAAFLEQFVTSGTPWAHFDIAGTAWNVANRLSYAPKKGASGVMVRTFVDLAQSYF